MKTINYISFLLITIILSACVDDKRHPGYEYMPDMYRSQAYKTYEATGLFLDSSSARMPVQGTIARGHMPYEYPNTNEGYEEAKKHLQNPFEFAVENNEDGKELYSIFCASCHGDRGDGQGHLVTNDKILGVPSYNDNTRKITEGSIYHVIMHGKGIMGSHASQLTEDERWKIVSYVEQLKFDLENN